VGRYLGGPPIEPALTELAWREIPVFVHPADCPHIDVLGFGRLSSIVEVPFDTARSVTNPFAGRTTRLRCPGTCNPLLLTLAVTIADHILFGNAHFRATVPKAEPAVKPRGVCPGGLQDGAEQVPQWLTSP
jgi:hypothetical protein